MTVDLTDAQLYHHHHHLGDPEPVSQATLFFLRMSPVSRRGRYRTSTVPGSVEFLLDF